MNLNNIFCLTQHVPKFITSACSQHKDSWQRRTVSFFELCPKSNAYFALTIHLDLDSPHFQCTVPTWGSWHTEAVEKPLWFSNSSQSIYHCVRRRALFSHLRKDEHRCEGDHAALGRTHARKRQEGGVDHTKRRHATAGLNACQKFCSHLTLC